MQADQKPVIWTVVIASIILLVLGGFATMSMNSNLKLLGTKLDGFDIDETALANAIVAGIVIPEMPEYDTEKIDELWDDAYGDDMEELEDRAFVESVYQFFDDNNFCEIVGYEEFCTKLRNADDLHRDDVETLVEEIDVLFESLEKQIYFEEDDDLFDFLEDEYEDESEGLIRVQFIREYEDDREFNVINLGLDDEDDREVELSSVIRVKIFLDEDDDTEYEFEKVYINSVVTSDDGELEAEVTYLL